MSVNRHWPRRTVTGNDWARIAAHRVSAREATREPSHDGLADRHIDLASGEPGDVPGVDELGRRDRADQQAVAARVSVPHRHVADRAPRSAGLVELDVRRVRHRAVGDRAERDDLPRVVVPGHLVRARVAGVGGVKSKVDGARSRRERRTLDPLRDLRLKIVAKTRQCFSFLRLRLFQYRPAIKASMTEH